MKILIVAASRHGSTRQIAEAIADELTAFGHVAEVQDAAKPWDIEPYDAAIIGSAIYMGKWLPDARIFVERNREQLSRVPVWLFSSGPLGDDNPQPPGDPPHIGEAISATAARGHQIFVGELDKSRLGLGERLMVKTVNAPEGDFRDWEAIRAWAHEIAATLETSAAPIG